MRGLIRLYADAYSGLPRAAWLIAAVLLVNRAGTMVVPFLALFLTDSIGTGAALAGRLVAVYGAGAMVGSWIGGWAADRLGAVRTTELSLVCTGVGLVAFTQLEGLPAIGTGLFVLGLLGEAFRPASMTALAARVSVERRARAFALARLAANLGMAIGPALGGLLAVHDYRLLFVADGATCLAAALVVRLTLRSRKAREIADRPEVRGPSPWSDPPFLWLMLWVVAVAGLLFQIFSTLPLYLRDAYAIREDVIGGLLGFNALLIVLFEMLLIRWVERFDAWRVLAAGSALMAFGLGMTALGTSVPFAALTIVVWTVGEMVAFPLMNVVVISRAPAGSQGRYMGLYTVAFAFAFIVAPMAGTWVLAEYGGRTLWLAIALAGPLVGGAALALGRRLR